jgi:isochorismate hydrolase
MYHLQGIKRLIKAQLDTIDVCIANDYPIIALEYNGKGRTIKPIREAVCRAKHMAIMTKNGEDGFYETNLANSLRCWNVNHPIYAGVSASGCVRSTMNGGINNGFTRFSTSDELIADCWDKKGKDKYPQVFYATSAVNYPKSNLELLTIISSSQ